MPPRIESIERSESDVVTTPRELFRDGMPLWGRILVIDH
jgi:hypothetical protein